VCPFCPGTNRTRRTRSSPIARGLRAERPRLVGAGDSEADPYFRMSRSWYARGWVSTTVSPRAAHRADVESRATTTRGHPGRRAVGQVLWMYGERIRDLKQDQSIRDILVTRRHPGARLADHAPLSRLTAIPISSTTCGGSSASARALRVKRRWCTATDPQRFAARDRVVPRTRMSRMLWSCLRSGCAPRTSQHLLPLARRPGWPRCRRGRLSTISSVAPRGEIRS